MEALDRLIARNANKLDPNQVLKPAEAKSIDDIKRFLAELDPSHNKPHAHVPVSATIDVAEDKQNVVYKVSADTQSKSKRDIIIQAFNTIKARIEAADKVLHTQEPVEINGKPMMPASVGNSISSASWVDKLLRQWFGAYRNGLMICWDLPDGYVYKYDIFLHKLTRARNGD